MYRRVLYLFMMFVLLFSACGNEEDTDQALGEPSEKELENLNESDMPIVNEEITLDFFAGQAPASNPDWNDVLVFNEYEDMTNINVDWEMTPHDSLDEKTNLALGGGTLPDAFHSANISEADLIKYGKQGVFIPLNDLIDDYAPNFKKTLEEYPMIEDAITMADGNIYSFPHANVPEFIAARTGNTPYINEEWLNALDMDMPETLDEYYDYLKAVKNESPSDGEVEEVPFGGPSIGTLLDYIKGSFGLANKGASNPFLDEDPETGEMRFYPTSEAYKDMLEYAHKLYDEGLIEENIFSIDHNQFITNLSEGKYGSVVWYAPEEVASKEKGKDYVGMPVLEGPNGEKTWTSLPNPVHAPGAFVITSDNEYPATTVRWMDHFFGEEGMELFFFGIEGETYELNEDDEPELMDHIMNSEDGLTFEEEIAKYLTYPGGGYPSAKPEHLYTGIETQPQSIEANEKLEPNIIEEDEIWPPFSHTEEENEQLSKTGVDIQKYVDEMTEKFISGNEPLSKWDEYVETIEKMGLEEYLEIKRAGLERFEK